MECGEACQVVSRPEHVTADAAEGVVSPAADDESEDDRSKQRPKATEICEQSGRKCDSNREPQVPRVRLV